MVSEVKGIAFWAILKGVLANFKRQQIRKRKCGWRFWRVSPVVSEIKGIAFWPILKGVLANFKRHGESPKQVITKELAAP